MFPREKLGAYLAIALVGIAQSALASSDWQIVKVRGRDYLTVDNVAKFYGLPIGVEPVAKRIRLDNGKNEIEVMLDSREVVINGVRNWLCFPVTEKDGKYLISRVDLAKTIEPELRPQMIKGLGQIKPSCLIRAMAVSIRERSAVVALRRISLSMSPAL